jgi:hypothetical protein
MAASVRDFLRLYTRLSIVSLFIREQNPDLFLDAYPRNNFSAIRVQTPPLPTAERSTGKFCYAARGIYPSSVGYRSVRKNARKSSTSSCGSSIGAKWPPEGITVQRLIL